MAAGSTTHKPRAKSLWLLVRRMLCRGSKPHRPTAGAAAGDGGDNDGGEKSSLLGRSGSLEELLGSDGAGLHVSVKKEVQHAVLPDHRQRQPTDMARPEATLAVSSARAGGAAMQQYRRFVFGGFRRRLMMRRQWRPMLVAIPE
ncbi:uncharacterized protein LOC124660927 [Lolium rigidum]|uniref:uncharacterized protein LOC124660927 n=1 Tax=Lolium rigidum TaxID=89674 RepID=UPI001F5CAAEA|nr:uncharacterized protein LOC124660927 [Lolium rigidum]